MIFTNANVSLCAAHISYAPIWRQNVCNHASLSRSLSLSVRFLGILRELWRCVEREKKRAQQISLFLLTCISHVAQLSLHQPNAFMLFWTKWNQMNVPTHYSIYLSTLQLATISCSRSVLKQFQLSVEFFLSKAE